MVKTYEHYSLVWRNAGLFDAELDEAFRLVDYLGNRLYKSYEPDINGEFYDRFNLWLSNVPDDASKMTLVRLMRYLYFFSQNDFNSLYRQAYNRVYSFWLLDQLGAVFDSQNFEGIVKRGIEESWFCPITDSMKINTFYHLNALKRDIRPDWTSLARLGDVRRAEEYILSNRIKHLVLIEDFVGTGSQMRDSVEFAAQLLHGRLPVLVMPMILCPPGAALGQTLERRYPNVSMRPVLDLPATRFVRLRATLGEPAFFAQLRALILANAARVQPPGRRWDKSPFGYRGTGGTVILHSNCPNNTIRVIFHSAGWHPLFPRSDR